MNCEGSIKLTFRWRWRTFMQGVGTSLAGVMCAFQKNSVFNCTGLRAINVASLILLAAFTTSHSVVILIY